MKNCGKSSGKCLKFVSKSGKDLGWTGVVKKQCEVCGLFNVKNREKKSPVAEGGNGNGICFPQGKIGESDVGGGNGK